MCVGVPMQVAEVEETAAICVADGERREVSTLLIDGAPLQPGEWLLIHVNAAVRRLSPDEAAQIRNALAAVLAAANDQPFEHLIADLIDREPELPAHLRAPSGS